MKHKAFDAMQLVPTLNIKQVLFNNIETDLESPLLQRANVRF